MPDYPHVDNAQAVSARKTIDSKSVIFSTKWIPTRSEIYQKINRIKYANPMVVSVTMQKDISVIRFATVDAKRYLFLSIHKLKHNKMSIINAVHGLRVK